MNPTSEWAEEILRRLSRKLAERSRPPRATYRLQFREDDLTFVKAREIVPYLAELGISNVYASPYLKTKSGSSHGYAVVDYGGLDPRLGSEENYESYLEALRQHGLEQILDIVPNHMAVAAGENSWWDDVLENGPGSPYADFFDIDWRPVKEELRNRVLLPVLGGQFGQVLESGELRLNETQGVFYLQYHAQTLPLDPSTFAVPLAEVLAELKQSQPPDSENVRELESILTALEYLPRRHELAPERIDERQREKEVIKDRLRRLSDSCPAFAEAVTEVVQRFNGQPGDPSSFDQLEQLLNAQVYRLSHWKAASDEINYRRFFDVNELAALSTELPHVFEETHRFVFELLAEGKISGVRIDHIDGLFDPLEYLLRLQRGYVRALARRVYGELQDERGGPSDNGGEPIAASETSAGENTADENAASENTAGQAEPAHPRWEEVEAELAARNWGGGEASAGPSPSVDGQPALYVVVEKILGPDEPLPPEWPVAGTTGYDFLNLLNGLFVDPKGLPPLLKLYKRVAQESTDFAAVAHEAKLLILRVAMSSELQLLAHRLNRISEKHRSSQDFTLNTLRIALREILACFPVYRTYANSRGIADRDRRIIHRAVARAKRRNPASDPAPFDFVSGVLLFEQPAALDEPGRLERDFFVGRFQQVTSPLIAKGIEDTAFYRYYPLVSLNEVGGDPAHAIVSVDDFHQHNRHRAERWPRAMICTSTHDTKRSEDVRARINVLSEIPQMWRDAVNRWTRFNRRHHRDLEGQLAPSRNDEYMIYQTLVGCWPTETLDHAGHQALLQRVTQYLEKATHEAKRHTSWISPDPGYDDAVRAFITAILTPNPRNQFLADFQTFHRKVLPWGLYSALSQALLKLASPGVPDIYQGQELWDFSLVDPDNRRPVDYPLRRQLLSELKTATASGGAAMRALAQQLAATPADPRIKLLVTWQTLEFRRMHPELFEAGRYEGVAAEGTHATNVCALAWRLAPSHSQPGKLALIVAPRLLAGLVPPTADGAESTTPLGSAVWQDTRLILPEPLTGPLHNLFTGQVCPTLGSQVAVGDALADFPVALLWASGA